MAALARDLAVEFKDVPTILNEHGLTQQQYDHLKIVPYFEQVLKQAVADWNKPGSTRERIALQAQFLLERSLPTMGTRLESDKEALGNVIEGIKTLADLGGVTNQPQQPAAQEKFIINIDLSGNGPAHGQVFETSRPIIDVPTIRPEPQGESAPTTIQPEPEGPKPMAKLQQIPIGLGALAAVRTEPEGH